MTIKDQVLSVAVNTLLTYKSRPATIRAALADHVYVRAEPPTRDHVTAAVVQMRLDLLEDGVAFAEKYSALVKQAVSQGAQLVVFPEYAWLPLLGMLPAVRELAQKGVTLKAAVDELAPGSGLTIDGVFRTIAPAAKRIFETTGSEIARRYGVWLMPGTTITVDAQGRLFNTAYLFGPDGQLIGTQNKLHPVVIENDWMTTGNELHVFDLPFAKLAMPVCMDFTYWETTRIATLRGAEILLDMSADEKANDFYLAIRGDEARVQECCAFSTRAYCVTRLFDLNFCGPSHIAAPIGACGNANVYLALAKTHDEEEIVVADLNFMRLRQFRADHPRDFNQALYEKYFPQAYLAYRQYGSRNGKHRIV